MCYTGEGFGAHAVVAYGVTYGQYNIDNVAYNGRILILDPNYNLKFENKTCLYFSTTNNNWTIPMYNLNSNNGAELCLVTNNMNLLNNKGYFSNATDDFINDNKYISILNMNNTNSNSYIDKVQNINGTWSINSNSNLGDIKVFYDFYNPNNIVEISPKYILTDFNSGYQISLDDYDYIDTDILYKNSLLQVEADNVDNVKFSPSGCIAINGKNTDYSMDLTFNNDYCTLPWYNVNITGTKSNDVSVTKVDNGFILNGDNLIDVTVLAYNDTISTSVNFDTFDNSVLIYAIDDYTIGIATYTEDNQSFKVDTLIAKSKEYSFNNSNKQSNIKGDLNYDGKLSSLDLVIQKKVVLGCVNITDTSIGDLNGDNLLNVLDVIILKDSIF